MVWNQERTLIEAIPLSDAAHIIDCIMSSTVQLSQNRKEFLAHLIAHRAEIREPRDREFLRAIGKAKGFRYP